MSKRLIAIIIGLFFISLSALSQQHQGYSSSQTYFILENDNARYFVIDESGNFDIYIFQTKLKEAKKPWYKQKAVEAAIKKGRVKGDIPKGFKELGFNQDALIDTYEKDSKEYYVFYNWTTDQTDDRITFVVEYNN